MEYRQFVELMKTLLSLLIICLLLAWAPAWAFTLSSDAAQTINFSANASVSTTVTLPTVNAGDFIRVVMTLGSNPAVNSITVSDPTNGTYTKKLGLYISNNTQGMQQFYFSNSAAGTNLVVTASYTSTNYVGVYAESWSGASVAGFNIEAGQTQLAPGTGVDAITSTAATTTGADLILGVCMDVRSNAPTTQTAGTGFATNTNGDQTGFMGLRATNLTQGSAGSQAALFRDATNGTTANFITLMMAVLPSGGAVTCPRTLSLMGVGC